MLENTDKFYQEVKKPLTRDKDGEYVFSVKNAVKVWMEQPGISSIDGGKVREYKSWAEYCKRNKFISSLNNGHFPDMILPAYFKKCYPEVTDSLTNIRKGKEYVNSSGLTRMAQQRGRYGANFTNDTQVKDSDESEMSEGELKLLDDLRNEARSKSQDDDDETMESDFDTGNQN